MKVTREVIQDLLPVYLSGEASSDTRTLVEEFLSNDLELARKVRERWSEPLSQAMPSALPPELELKTLRRTRRMLAWQKWSFAMAITFSALMLSLEISWDGRHQVVRLLMLDYPVLMLPCLTLALIFWAIYLRLRRRSRTSRG